MKKTCFLLMPLFIQSVCFSADHTFFYFHPDDRFTSQITIEGCDSFYQKNTTLFYHDSDSTMLIRIYKSDSLGDFIGYQLTYTIGTFSITATFGDYEVNFPLYYHNGVITWPGLPLPFFPHEAVVGDNFSCTVSIIGQKFGFLGVPDGDPFPVGTTNYTIIKDHIPPSLTVSCANADQWQSEATIIVDAIDSQQLSAGSGSGVDPNNVFYSVDNNAYIKMQNDSNTTITSYNDNTDARIAFNFQEEGVHQIKFKLRDMLGNVAETDAITVKIDRQGPLKPAGIKTSLTTAAQQDGNRKLNGIALSWDKQTDDLPEGVELVDNSGVAGYQVSWMPAQDFDTSKLNVKKPDSGVITDTALHLNLAEDGLDRGKSYKFAVRSVDNAGNAGDWGVSEPVFIPPAAIEIENVEYTNASVNAGGIPQYEGKIIFNQGRGFFFNPENGQLVIKSVAVEYDSGLLVNSPIGMDSPQAPWAEERGKLVYTFKLAGKAHAHKAYTFTPVTTFVTDDAVENGVPYSAVPVLNIKPAFTVEIKGPDGKQFGRIEQNGYIPGTKSALYIDTNAALHFKLKMDSNDGVSDAEGDVIRYQLFTMNDKQLGGDAWSDAPQGEIVYAPPQSEILHCYINCAEYAVVAGGDHVPLNEIIQTKHDNGGVPEGFHLFFDFNDANARAFSIRSRDGNTVYSNARPTNTRDVEVYVPAGGITDATGAIDSGISAVYAWNSTMPDPLPPEFSNIESYIIANQPLDSSKTPLQISSAANNPAPQDEFRLPWQLEGQSGVKEERECIVAMKVVDGADNISYFYRIVRLDTKPPAAPDPSSFAHVYNQLVGNELDITWSPGVDCVGYSYAYTINGNTIANLSNTPAINDIDTSGYPANTPITVVVYGIDSAGNQSETAATYTPPPYTPASLGNLVPTNDEYNAQTKEHYFKWTVSGGNAASFEVEQLNPDGSIAARILVDGSGSYVQTGLSPHETRSYRLVAINGSRDKVKGTIFTRTLKNIPPSAPSDLIPAGFAKGNDKLSWYPSTDGDGDQCTYDVYYKGAGQTEYTVVHAGTDFQYPVDIAGLSFGDGTTYSFRVRANDGYGGTAESAETSFIVDLKAPTITFTALPTATDKRVTVTISDEGSGLASACYWSSDGALGTEAAPTPLVVTRGAKTFTTDIPMPNGQFTFYVRANDVAGNEGNNNSNLQAVDETKPEITNAAVRLDKLPDGRWASSGVVRINLGCKDDNSGVKDLRYGYADAQGGAVASWLSLTLESAKDSGAQWQVKTFAPALPIPVSDGRTVYLVLKVVDWAGNESEEMRVPDGIFVDSTPPVASLSVTGYTSYFGYYVKSIDQLTVNQSYTENDSPVIAVAYAVVADGTMENAIDWKNDYLTAKNITYVNGAAYYIMMKVTNAVGLSDVAKSETFICDSTGAFNLNLAGLSATPYVQGQPVECQATAEDQESPIALYRLAIGTATDPTAFSREVNGAVGGWITAQGNRSALFAFTVPAKVADGSYRLRLEVVNASGMVSALDNAGTITVDNSLETVVVTTTGAYSSSRDTLRAAWQYYGPRHPVEYDYRILRSEGTALTAWTSTLETSATATGLPLVNGAAYYFEVRANLDSGSPVTGLSPAVTVDYTPPVFDSPDGLVTPPAATTDGLWLSYRATDDESGLVKAEVLLQKYDADNNKVDIGGGWIELPVVFSGEKLRLQTDARGQPLALATGDKIYVTLRVTNGALAAADAYAPAIVIDDTPPPAPLVIDQSDALNTAQYPSASWIWSKEDPESGTVSYQWAIVKSPSDVNGAVWHPETVNPAVKTYEADVGQTLGSTFLRNHLDVWYFAVRAVNGAGLSILGMSNGFIYDNTAPLLAKAMLMQNGTEALYIQDFNGATVSITALEPESEISRYEAAPGKWNGNGDWEPLTGGITYTAATNEPLPVDNPAPPASPGDVVVFRASCVNNAGLVSEYGYTQGALVYTQAPAVKNVRARVNGLSIYCDWEDVAGDLPVKEYVLELWRKGTTEERALALTTTQKNLVINGTSLAAGRYAAQVRARSVNGIAESKASESPYFFLDTTPPVVTSLRTPKFASQSITIAVLARDDESGLAEYQYAIGTFVNAGAFTGGYRSFMSTSGSVSIGVNFSDLASGLAGVQDGSVVYVRLKARNANGLMTDERLSDPIVIDKSPPETPVVTVANAYTRFADRIEGVAVTSRDAQSGLFSAAYAVTGDISEPGLAAALWSETLLPGNTFVLDVSNQTVNGLALKQGDSVYVAVKTKNGAGDWSAAGLSPLVKADLVAPQVEFTGGQDVIVVNDAPLSVPYRVIEDVSGTVDVTFTLECPDGSSETTTVTGLAAGNHRFSFGKTAYGAYELRATAKDLAGNESPQSAQRLRVNAPVQITLYDVDTTPGKPLELSAVVVDPDGDTPYAYLWKFGDGTADSNAANPIHPYYQSEKYAQRSTYTISLEVTDSQGKKSTASCTVTVENTKQGRLYTDEYWGGTHNIVGNVLVPQGIALTVMAGATVGAGNADLQSYDVRLTIEGRLVTESGARFTLAGDANALWNGIVVKGEAGVDNITIEKAKRGLTVLAGANVGLSNTTFNANEIGLHVFGTIEVDACAFTANTIYGIKEDGGGAPTVSNCVFDGNTYDYYDSELTVISADELNGITGNSGNRRR